MAKRPPKKVAAVDATEAEKTSVYEVISPLRRNGEKFAAGDEIELSEIEAGDLGPDVVKPKIAGDKTE